MPRPFIGQAFQALRLGGIYVPSLLEGPYWVVQQFGTVTGGSWEMSHISRADPVPDHRNGL